MDRGGPSICLGVVLAVIAGGIRPAFAETERFDHAEHGEKAQVKCNACHKLSAKDAWDTRSKPVGGRGGTHTPCAQSGCHAKDYLAFRKRGQKLCLTCHEGGPRGPIRFPPYRKRGSSDFVLSTFDHGQHGNETGCKTCHQPKKKTKRKKRRFEFRGRTHESCGTKKCHGRSEQPLMTDCSGCHQSATTQTQVASSKEQDPFRVRRKFSHVGHQKVSPRDECAACHSNVNAPKGRRVPLPPMIACESCHDGHRAFSALGTTCTGCHVKPKKLKRSKAASATYSHLDHEKRGLELNCNVCHQGTTSDGRLSWPTKDHKPCANAACHAEDFRKPEAKVCFVCHDGSEPWGKKRTRAKFRDERELDLGFPHDSHLKGGKEACATCHAEQAGIGARPSPPNILAPSHALCASCHEALSKPRMTECSSCHVKPRGSAQDVWRVAEKFKHDDHRSDARKNGRKLECVNCHDQVPASGKTAAPPRPTMAGCIECHDGRLSFKATGFDCLRCHQEVE